MPLSLSAHLTGRTQKSRCCILLIRSQSMLLTWRLHSALPNARAAGKEDSRRTCIEQQARREHGGLAQQVQQRQVARFHHRLARRHRRLNGRCIHMQPSKTLRRYYFLDMIAHSEHILGSVVWIYRLRHTASSVKSSLAREAAAVERDGMCLPARWPPSRMHPRRQQAHHTTSLPRPGAAGMNIRHSNITIVFSTANALHALRSGGALSSETRCSNAARMWQFVFDVYSAPGS